MKKSYYLVIILLFAFSSCNNQITEGKIVSMSYTPPHEEEYQTMNRYPVGKIWFTQWNTNTRYVSDTTYYMMFMKDTMRRELEISQEDYYQYHINDYIQLSK